MKLNDWAELKFKANAHPYAIVADLPARQKLLLALWRPRAFASWLHLRFAKDTMIPGDTFENFQADTTWHVVSVRGRVVLAEAYGNQRWRELGCQPAPPNVPRQRESGTMMTLPGPHVSVYRFELNGPEVAAWTLPRKAAR